MKCQAGWITSQNRDCQEKYQQLQICRWYHSNGRKWRGTKEPLWKWKRGVGNIQKTKIVACSPITSWQLEGEKVEAATEFSFLGSRITLHGDCSHEVKRCSLLGRKAVTNLDSIFKKQRHHFTDKGSYSESFSSFHVWMWELDYKKAEHWRIDAFKLC